MATMARLRKDKNSFQELVPGIPDQITIQHIATKLTWESCDAMRVVSRGWHRAVGNRSVYDARVLSNSTEPFLFIPWESDYSGEPGLTLFSCKRFSCLRLPPIPVASRKVTSKKVDEKIEAICLDGKVYVWVRTDLDDCAEPPCKWEETCTCVLDLGGDKKWTVSKRKRYSYSSGHGLGVLDGKIYRFQGSTHPKSGTLHGRPYGNDFDERGSTDSKILPTTEVYDPLSDVWSRITPKPRFEDQGVKDYLPCLTEWASAQQAADVSESFLAYGRYEPFFSEWRRAQAADGSSTALATDDPRRSAVATQVYSKNDIKAISADWDSCERLFFLGGRLLRYLKRGGRPRTDDETVILDLYDRKKNKWKEYRILSASDDATEECEELEEEFHIVHFVAIDNVIWAILGIGDLRFCLVRSPVLQYNHEDCFSKSPVSEYNHEEYRFERYHEDEGDLFENRSHSWIDIACSLSKDFLDARPGRDRLHMQCRYSRRVLMLRPIYL